MSMKRINYSRLVSIIEQAINDKKSPAEIATLVREYYWEVHGRKEIMKAIMTMQDTHSQKQISAATGVSQATVSKLINGGLLWTSFILKHKYNETDNLQIIKDGSVYQWKDGKAEADNFGIKNDQYSS